MERVSILSKSMTDQKESLDLTADQVLGQLQAPCNSLFASHVLDCVKLSYFIFSRHLRFVSVPVLIAATLLGKAIA
jgi:hypothetical protein